MRISDWSSDVCSSDLVDGRRVLEAAPQARPPHPPRVLRLQPLRRQPLRCGGEGTLHHRAPALADHQPLLRHHLARSYRGQVAVLQARSEEHTSELQSLMRISYAFFCLQQNTTYSTR